jgi:plastocyanin domain-containing protein
MGRLALLIVILAVGGCTPGLKKPVNEMTAISEADTVQRITVKTHSFWFEPNRIVVKRGVPVVLTVKNGAMFVPHDFYCSAKEAGIEIDAKVGMFHGKKVVRFTPTQNGEFGYACGVDSHAEKKGMKGTLVVKD